MKELKELKEAVTAETNLNGKKTRKSSVPQDLNRFTESALSLPLVDRVGLRNELTESIDLEIKRMEDDFNQAKKIVGG